MIHGRISTYTLQRCRCVECRRAWTLYFQDYRRRKVLKGACLDCCLKAVEGFRRCKRHLMIAKVKAGLVA